MAKKLHKATSISALVFSSLLLLITVPGTSSVIYGQFGAPDATPSMPPAAANSTALLWALSQTGGFSQNVTSLETSTSNFTTLTIVTNGTNIRANDIFEDELSDYGRLNGMPLIVFDYVNSTGKLLLFVVFQGWEGVLTEVPEPILPPGPALQEAKTTTTEGDESSSPSDTTSTTTTTTTTTTEDNPHADEGGVLDCVFAGGTVDECMKRLDNDDEEEDEEFDTDNGFIDDGGNDNAFLGDDNDGSGDFVTPNDDSTVPEEEEEVKAPQEVIEPTGTKCPPYLEEFHSGRLVKLPTDCNEKFFAEHGYYKPLYEWEDVNKEQ